ncbi:MAG: methyl-accepting chemotaxis protein, partial [Vibrionaceae bacterium]|nr:methyl-accepting chemotaxis protein [Vibrionaceae bacterium]
MLNSLKIKHKLALPIVLLATVIATTTTLNVIQADRQESLNDQLNNEVQPVMDSLEDGYRDLYQVITAAQGVMLAKTQADIDYNIEEFKDNAYKAVPRLSKASVLVEAGHLSPEQQREIDKIAAATTAWVKLYEPMFENPSQAISYYEQNREKLDNEFRIIREQLTTIREQVEQLQLTL